MEEKTDAELVQLARTGDKTAFGELYNRYQALAKGIARRLVSRDECARELVQDAMLQAYLSLPQIRDPGAFKGWLCGIVVNVCRGYLRDQKTAYFSLESLAGGRPLDSVASRGIEASPEQIAEESELHQCVLAAVNALAPHDREIVLSFYYDQLSAQEIAILLKITTGAVKVRLHRARQRLREKVLSLHTDLLVDVTRRKKMVRVKIADVVKSEKTDDKGQKLNLHAIILVDEGGRRAMPIWVGPFEGQSIAMEIGRVNTPRPLTFSFISSLLKAINATLEEVRIDALKENTFFATVKIKCGSIMREVDARPSDAMALALICGCPILASEEVLSIAAVRLPDTVQPAAVGPGISQILEEIGNPPRLFKKGPTMSKEEIQKANLALIAGICSPK